MVVYSEVKKTCRKSCTGVTKIKNVYAEKTTKRFYVTSKKSNNFIFYRYELIK